MWKKSLIYKTWERYCRKKRPRVAPEAEAGCFSVYVGPQRQRFVVKTQFANHPLFAMLLEDAESEYGYNSEGPILLPCAVDLFYKVLAEMDGSSSGDDHNNNNISSSIHSTCGLIAKGYGSLIQRFSPAHHHGAYMILRSPSQ